MSHSLQQGKSSSTGNLLDKDDLALPPPDYGTSSRAFPTQTASTFKQRPYSVAVPAFSQVSQGGARVPRDCRAQGWASRLHLAMATYGPLPSAHSGLQIRHGGPPAALPSGWGVTGSDPALDTASREEPGHHGDLIPRSLSLRAARLFNHGSKCGAGAGTFSKD